jgi:hypothetical protein
MTDPYRQHPNPYGQQPSQYGPDPQGGPQNPYGQGQPNSYGARPDPRGQQPDPYGGQDPYAQQPDRHAQQDPEATQVLPYAGQYGPGQPHQYRQYEPNQFAPGGPGDPYGHNQGSYGQPPGWGQGGGLPPGPPRKSRPPMVLFSVLAVLVIVAGVITTVLLTGGDSSTPAAQTTSTPLAQPETASQAPATTTTTITSTTQPPTTASSASGKTFEAGQCATLTPEPAGSRATLNEALCGDTNSDVIVALVQDGDCVKDYITFSADVGKVYCLALDAEEGACFKFDQLAKRASSCVAGTHKVAKIFEKVTDSSRCDQVRGADRRYAYTQPPRTVCLVPAA